MPPTSTSPGATITAVRPSQAVPGKRTPAETAGEAHPMSPSGGRTPAANASGILHAAAVRFVVQATVSGSERKPAATIHVRVADMVFASANVA
jgi:hypothetical protein